MCKQGLSALTLTLSPGERELEVLLPSPLGEGLGMREFCTIGMLPIRVLSLRVCPSLKSTSGRDINEESCIESTSGLNDRTLFLPATSPQDSHPGGMIQSIRSLDCCEVLFRLHRIRIHRLIARFPTCGTNLIWVRLHILNRLQRP